MTMTTPAPNERAPRRARLPIHGLLLLDKPAGLSSNAALQRARWLLRAARAGHTGTLDPLATGLLPLAFGEATKFCGTLLDADKSYLARVRLGERTTTGDAEGEVIERRAVNVDAADIAEAAAAFCGEIEQIPPMHSALKRDGKPLYAYARAGVDVERAPRRVRILALETSEFDPDSASFTLHVTCSKGTYIRTLAEDIGERLGCGAHLVALRRTAIGPLRIENALTLDALEAAEEAQRAALLAPPDALLGELPAQQLNEENARAILHGQRIRAPHAGAAGLCRLYRQAVFLGLGEVRADGFVYAKRLLASVD